jgi:hypothetical protein
MTWQKGGGMMRLWRATLMAAVVLSGCGPGTQPAPGSGAGGGGSDPNNVSPPPATSDGRCNDLTAAGGTIMDQIGTSMPALGGGTMADGSYVLTKYEWYTPNQLHTRTITMVISGGGRYGQYLWQRDSDPEQRVTVNIATSGDRIAMRAICPAGSDLEWDRYGVDGGGLTLYSTRDTKAAFFTRQ